MFKMSGREGFTGKGYWHKDLEEIRRDSHRYLEEGQSGKCKDLKAGAGLPSLKSKEACNGHRWGGAEDLARGREGVGEADCTALGGL